MNATDTASLAHYRSTTTACEKCGGRRFANDEIDQHTADAHPAPTAGLGATEHLYSDSNPYVITRVNDRGDRMWVRRVELDESTRDVRHEGFPIHTTQGDLAKPKGPEEEIRLRKNGRWIRVGGDGSIRFTIGHSVEVRDYRY